MLQEDKMQFQFKLKELENFIEVEEIEAKKIMERLKNFGVGFI